VTVTEKTITVPVSAIEALRSGRDGLGAYGTTYVAAQSLIDLLPKPFKVGDTVTRENRNDLPLRSVISDKDGDLWVRLDGGYAYLNVDDNERITAEGANSGPADFYGPFTVVYIKESK
jgi:hypothetical protein